VDAAVFGSGFSGAGELVTVLFRVLAPGDPKIGFGEVRARDGENRDVAVRLDGTGGITPAVTRLLPTAPNPFQEGATVAFTLAGEGPARVQVFGLDGRLVRELLDGVLPAGAHRFRWDGTDASGRAVASGTYLIRLATREGSESHRVVRLR
jgi:hypothetical protein